MSASVMLPPRRDSSTTSATAPRYQRLESDLERLFRESLAHARERAVMQASEEIVRLRTDAELEQVAEREQIYRERDAQRLQRHCDWKRKSPAPVPIDTTPATPKGELIGVSVLAGCAAAGAFLALCLARNPAWFSWINAIIVFGLAALAPPLSSLALKHLLKTRPRAMVCAYSVAVPACALSIASGVLLLWKGPCPMESGPVTAETVTPAMDPSLTMLEASKP